MKTNQKILKNKSIDIKIKLSALWMLYMFLFIYTDHYKLYMPGVLNDMMSGISEGMQLSQSTLLGISIISIIPALMIFISLTLTAIVNRWVNIIIGFVYILISITSLIGHAWAFWIFYCTLLTIVAALIVIYSWKWPSDISN